MDYLDLYLLHWPMALAPGDPVVPIENDTVIPDKTPIIDTWRVLEKVFFYLQRASRNNINILQNSLHSPSK